ncbi:hypothetical protein ABLE91_18910 [Aquabacter sp. CN5-332]|uniref:hypothetical protein n=1 Tax=Aquabacter sp. CN5-332 TaxID=3156608 RepID=UPI0032B33BA6
MALPLVPLANSSFLDFTSYRTTNATTPHAAYGLPATPTEATGTINVAIILNRATDPTAFLNASWGERQQMLASMTQAELWQKYGANPADYATVVSQATASIASGGAGAVLLDNYETEGYVSSAESRTVWLQLTAAGFKEMFGTQLNYGYSSKQQYDTYYWDNALSIPRIGMSPASGSISALRLQPPTCRAAPPILRRKVRKASGTPRPSRRSISRPSSGRTSTTFRWMAARSTPAPSPWRSPAREAPCRVTRKALSSARC